MGSRRSPSNPVWESALNEDVLDYSRHQLEGKAAVFRNGRRFTPNVELVIVRFGSRLEIRVG